MYLNKANIDFPNLNDYIEDIARQSIGGQRVLKELDEELFKNKKLISSQGELRADVESLELDAYILNDIASQQKEQTFQREAEEKKALQCYESIMELKNVIKHLDLGKIIMCDLLKKHIELVSDWRFKEKLFKKKFEQSLTMDNRPEVRQLRTLIAERLRLEKEIEYIKEDSLQCKKVWDNRISKSIAKRNQLIVELIKGQKELIEEHQRKQSEKRQGNYANVDKSFTKSFESFFNVNKLFNSYAIPRPICVALPSSSSKMLTLETKRSILCVPGVKTNESTTKKKVHFKPDLESVVLIQKTTTEAYNSDTNNGIHIERNFILRAEETIETVGQESNLTCEQRITVKDNTADIGSEVQSPSSSSDCDTINAETTRVQNEKPKILENIIIQPANVSANDIELDFNASSLLDAKHIFKVPQDIRNNVSPPESSVVSTNESTLESDAPNDSLSFYKELIKKSEENKHELNMNSYDDNKDRAFNSVDWNFQVPHASDDFFFDTPIIDQKPNESFF